MRRWKIAGWALAALVAVTALRATAQQDEAPILKPRPKSATLLVTCDLACNWTLDGESMGHIDAAGSAKAKVGFGSHVVVGKTLDGLCMDGSDIEIKAQGQTVVHILLKAHQEARLRSEQLDQERAEEQARLQAAHEQAERERQERERQAREQAAQEERQKELERQAQEQAALMEPTLRNNEGVDLFNQKRYKEAAPLLKSACDGGVLEGCESLGMLYDSGRGVSRNYAQARSLYTRACDGGQRAACAYLGWMYQKGHGVPRDYGQARLLYEQACDGGNMFGCDGLGMLYLEGNGVSPDYAQAEALFRKACDGGEQDGCKYLSRMLGQ